MARDKIADYCQDLRPRHFLLRAVGEVADLDHALGEFVAAIDERPVSRRTRPRP